MSFETYETSRTQGGPQTLYRFSYQSQVFAYTDAEVSIIFEGTEYQPIPVDRGALSSSGSLDKTALSIDMPHDTGIAELFRVFPPSDVVVVTVFQGHDSYPEIDFLSVWTGRVLSASRQRTTCTLVCEPISTSMKRPGLRRRYQYGCPHALYGTQCGVNRADFSVTATVQSTSGATVTLETGWNGAFAETNFHDGLLEFTENGATALRTILRVNTALNRLTVSGKVAGLSAGDQVTLSLGCNHQMTGCETFSNIQNFGGNPWIPKINPLSFVNKFY